MMRGSIFSKVSNIAIVSIKMFIRLIGGFKAGNNNRGCRCGGRGIPGRRGGR